VAVELRTLTERVAGFFLTCRRTFDARMSDTMPIRGAVSSYSSRRRARNSSTSDDVIAQNQAPAIPEYHHTRCQRISVKVSAYTATAVTTDATATRTNTNARPRANVALEGLARALS
jgi:hypothetical protein